MPQNQKLLPPLPTFVDRTHPRVIAWRQDLHENAINELHQSKMENTRSSILPFLVMAATWIMGALGLISPEFVAKVLKALVP